MGEGSDKLNLASLPVKAAAWVVGLPYAGLMRLRRSAYRCRLMPSHEAGVPVICVGNITCGGTGKTPMVAWVVRQLKEANRRPAILTRGYKAVEGKSDEAELLEQLTGVPVVVEADRVSGAKAAIADGADVLVMDDGFQHMRLRRDLDIVLIDATNPFGGGCPPAGLRREPLSALLDAGVIVITRSNLIPKDRLEKLKTRLSRLGPSATVHTAVHKPVAVIDQTGRRLPVSAVEGRRVSAFCGLGNPAGFFKTLERIGADVAVARSLKDHVRYTPRLIASLSAAAVEAGAELLVTTQKDFVKLREASFELPVWQLAVEVEVVEGPRVLAEAILYALE